MQTILPVIFCCVCYQGLAQTTNTVPTISVSPPTSEEFTSSNPSFTESTKPTNDRFSCVLNILKNALAEELKKTYYRTDDEARDNVSPVNSDTGEKESLVNYENQLEKPASIFENETSALSENQKPLNVFEHNSTQHNNIEMPNMIPIFKQRSQPMIAQNHNVAFSATPKRQVPISKAVTFMPEKIIQTMNHESELNYPAADSRLICINSQLEQPKAASLTPEQLVPTNFNAIPSQTIFNVPCQRAVDILDMNVMFPDHRNTNVIPISNAVKSNIHNQIPVPAKCVSEDDTVAMLFKPKNISLQQVYGNLLKKITLTVLVPYHMSKLGDNRILK